MPVLVGGKPPKKRFNIKGEWIAIGLGLPALLVMFAIATAPDEKPKPRESVSQPQASPPPVAAAPPVATPVAAPQPDGIGVSRAAVQSIFEQSQIGFKFEQSSDVQGQSRVIGESPNGLAFVELIGPSSNLTNATIVIGFPSDDQQARMLSAAYILGFIKNAAPEWTDGNDWVAKNMAALTNGSATETSTTFADKKARLILVREMGLFTLSIKPN